MSRQRQAGPLLSSTAWARDRASEEAVRTTSASCRSRKDREYGGSQIGRVRRPRSSNRIGCESRPKWKSASAGKIRLPLLLETARSFAVAR